MVKWIIKYWNPETKLTEFVMSEDVSWQDVPAEGVISVQVMYTMERPHGNPDTLYTTVLKGTDFYYLHEEFDSVVFGGYNDEIVSPTSTDTPGFMYRYIDGKVEHQVYAGNAKPECVAEEEVKAGIWVPEPWAAELGITNG